MNIKVVIDRRTQDLNTKQYMAKGIVHVYEGERELIHEYFISGPWGKGHLPVGNYKIKYVRLDLNEAFKLQGFGWFAYLEPQFDTDRTELGIHPDGGKYLGTLGCVGMRFKTQEFNKKFYNFLVEGLKKGDIDVEVIDASKKVETDGKENN